MKTFAQVAPEHITYWRGKQLPGYQGGPFADRSGGLIIFQAPSPEVAASLVAHDPFLTNQLLEQHWLKEWSG